MNPCSLTFAALLIIGTRLLFAVHAFVVVWRVSDIYGNVYWIFMAGLLPLTIDLAWVLYKRKARDWTWYRLPVAIYLVVVVPCIWLLRLQHVDSLMQNIMDNNCNKTDARNGTRLCVDSSGAGSVEAQAVALSDFFGVSIPIRLESGQWVDALDQSLIFVLIITRWMTPLKGISHRKLSELLLVYVGLGSDIVELFSPFSETRVLLNEKLHYLVLAVWSVSLLQFTLPITGTLGRSRLDSKSKGNCWKTFVRSEMWTVAAIVLLQDGPFLGVRLYVMITQDLVTYNLVFFTCKNIVVVILQFYRLAVLICCVDPHTGESIRRRPRTPRSSGLQNGNGAAKGRGRAAPDLAGVDGPQLSYDGSHDSFGNGSDTRDTRSNDFELTVDNN